MADSVEAIFFAAHADDIELACGGTIVKMVRDGHRAGIVDLIATVFREHKLLLATQVYETVDPDGVADVTSRFDWSTLRTYDIDPPGRNHGLLLGTRGWTVNGEPFQAV